MSGEPDSDAFDLVPATGASRSAALCLHGLTGKPYEVRPVAEALAARGIRARGPSLLGHDSTPEDLRAVDQEEWVGCARVELEKLRDEHAQVFLVGVSMGGLVSLKLASEQPVDGIATIGVPLRLRHAGLLRLLPLVMHFHRYSKKQGGSDIQEPGARARHPSYDRMPLRSVNELTKLQREVVPLLPRISAPILVAHGACDSTAEISDAYRIAGGVSGKTRRLLVLERSGHVVTVDYDGPRLTAAIADFFTGIAR